MRYMNAEPVIKIKNKIAEGITDMNVHPDDLDGAARRLEEFADMLDGLAEDIREGIYT